MSLHDDIIETMGPREVIARAIAMLRDLHHVSEAAAFEMLVSGSSDSQEKVREVAAAILRRSHP